MAFSSRDYGQVIGIGNYPWGLKFSQVNAYPTIPSLSNLGLSTMMDGSEFYSDIPLSVITKDAFYNCSSLNSIKVLSANSIEDETFMGCDNAYEIALPPLLSIGNIFGDDRSTLSVMALSVQNET